MNLMALNTSVRKIITNTKRVEFLLTLLVATNLFIAGLLGSIALYLFT